MTPNEVCNDMKRRRMKITSLFNKYSVCSPTMHCTLFSLSDNFQPVTLTSFCQHQPNVSVFIIINLHIVLFLFVFVYPNSVLFHKILYFHIPVTLFVGSFKNKTLMNGEGLV